MTISRRVVFLPGASGDPSFWYGVGKHLPTEWDRHFLSWPGLGDQAPDPQIRGFADLLSLSASQLTSPSVVIAQSMGGVIAVQLAQQYPERVTHLVLVATSGGLDVTALGAQDWRPDFLRAFPQTARWILEEKIDLSSRLKEIEMPTLLLWGDADPISPPAVGHHLEAAIPGARLKILPEADHGMGMEMPDIVASHVMDFISEQTGTNAAKNRQW